jgi:hypothetical protein
LEEPRFLDASGVSPLASKNLVSQRKGEKRYNLSFLFLLKGDICRVVDLFHRQE